MKFICNIAPALILAPALLLLAGACSADAEDVADRPWAAEFRRVYESAESQFVRDAVADGELTLAEKREAATRTNECFVSVDASFEIREGSTFYWIYTGEPSATVEESAAAWEAATTPESQDCIFRYWNDLAILWELTVTNPLKEDLDALVVECLVRNQLADERLTIQQFQESAAMCHFHFDVDPDVDLSVEEMMQIMQDWEAENEGCRPVLPNGVYLDEGIARDCQLDPRS